MLHHVEEVSERMFVASMMKHTRISRLDVAGGMLHHGGLCKE